MYVYLKTTIFKRNKKKKNEIYKLNKFIDEPQKKCCVVKFEINDKLLISKNNSETLCIIIFIIIITVMNTEKVK